jgi:hypothetical protein
MNVILDLSGIKNLFKQGIQYSEEKFPQGLFIPNKKLCQYQLELVENAPDLTTLMNAVSIHNPVFFSSFITPKPICDGCEIQYIPMQFGVGHKGWYFCYGIAEDTAFVFSITRIEIAPKKVVEKNGLQQTDAVRWCIGGGFGKNGYWYKFPHEFIYMKYIKNDYSTFSLSGSGSQIRNIIFQNSLNQDFTDPNPMQFYFTADFTDQNGDTHNLVVSASSRTPPLPNAPNSCNDCGDNMGTFYFSYTDMDVIVNPDQEGDKKGKGVFEHQISKSGIPRNIFTQGRISVANLLYPPKSHGWLSLYLQDFQTGLQYKLTHFFDRKSYEDDIYTNQKIYIDQVIVYEKGISYFNPSRTDIDSSDAEVIPTEFVYVNGASLPSKFNIILPGGKSVVLKIFSLPNQYLDPYGNYETPCVLNDTIKNIGMGLIEVIGYYTSEEYAERYISSAGGDVGDKKRVEIVAEGFSPKFQQNFWQVLLSVIIFLIPLWFIVRILIFVIYKKENRFNRLMFSIALILILYAIVYSFG